MKIREFRDDLKSVYRENDYPSDRLFHDRRSLGALTRAFNARVGGSFSVNEVEEELERIRKDKKGTGGLPRLGRSYRGPRFKPSDN